MTKPNFQFLTRTLIAFAFASLVPSLAWATPVSSEGNGVNAMPPDGAQRIERGVPHNMQARLDRLSKRLNIGAGQQNAWSTYTQAVLALKPQPMSPPSGDVTATTIARNQANMAAARAQKVAQLASATEQLEQVLDTNQRQVFDRMAQRFQNRRHLNFGERGPSEAPTT